jgi:hypothetical protein
MTPLDLLAASVSSGEKMKGKQSILALISLLQIEIGAGEGNRTLVSIHRFRSK